MTPVANSVASMSQASQTKVRPAELLVAIPSQARSVIPVANSVANSKTASQTRRELKIDPRNCWSQTRRKPVVNVVSYSPYPIEFTTLCCTSRLNSFGWTNHILRGLHDTMRSGLRRAVNESLRNAAITPRANHASRLRCHVSVIGSPRRFRRSVAELGRQSPGAIRITRHFCGRQAAPGWSLDTAACRHLFSVRPQGIKPC